MTDRQPFGEHWQKHFREPWWWPKPYSIKMSTPETLEIAGSRPRAAAGFVGLVVANVFWYWVLFQQADARYPGNPIDGFIDLVHEHLWLIVFPFMPLLSLPTTFRLLRAWIAGESFLFHRDTGIIEKNGTPIARFQDVHRVQTDSARSGEGVEYTISIVLNDEKHLPLIRVSDIDDVQAPAKKIARFVDVDVTWDELTELYRSRH